MNAIILAAGRGSRMGERTNLLPKCMTELWGKPLINWQIDILKEAGIKNISIVVGYQSEKVKLDNVHYFYNNQWRYTNVLASLLTAKSWLDTTECIIAYSDILYTPTTIKMLIESPKDIVITYNTNFLELWKQRFEDPLIDLETFKTNKQSMLLEIGDSTNKIEEIEGQFMGLLKITPDGFNDICRIMKSQKLDVINQLDITGALQLMLKENISINTIKCDEFWIEVDNEKDLNLYQSWSFSPHNFIS